MVTINRRSKEHAADFPDPRQDGGSAKVATRSTSRALVMRVGQSRRREQTVETGIGPAGRAICHAGGDTVRDNRGEIQMLASRSVSYT